MKMLALIVYGTRWGGTVGIAQKIGEVLKAEGYTVDVCNAKQCKKNIENSDLIIVGSGIRADKWTKETIDFLKKNAQILKTKRVALFVSCQMADRTEKEVREKAKLTYLKKVAEQFGLNTVSLGFFGGFLDFRTGHGLLVDILIRVNRKSLKKNGLDTRIVHDTRDWSSIESWAKKLAE